MKNIVQGCATAQEMWNTLHAQHMLAATERRQVKMIELTPENRYNLRIWEESRDNNCLRHVYAHAHGPSVLA